MPLPGVTFTTYQPGDLGHLTFLNLSLLVLKIGDEVTLLCAMAAAQK